MIVTSKFSTLIHFDMAASAPVMDKFCTPSVLPLIKNSYIVWVQCVVSIPKSLKAVKLIVFSFKAFANTIVDESLLCTLH